jgi:hypothetical protein
MSLIQKYHELKPSKHWVFHCLLFSLIFWIPRIYYLKFNCLAGFSKDSFDYFGIAYSFSNYNIPDLGVIPPLYPLILLLFSSVDNIILFQMVFSFSSLCFLVFSFYRLLLVKHKLNISFYVVLFLTMLYSWDSYILYLETSLMTESTYMSLLNFFIGMLFVLKFNNNSFLFFWISFLVFLIAFCRSNGIYLYPIWGAILLWAIMTGKKDIKVLAYSFVFLNLLWCFLNFASTKTFFIGNAYRIKSVSKNSSNELVGNSELKIYDYNVHANSFMDEDYSKNIHSKKARLLNYLYDFQERKKNFFSESIPLRESMYLNDPEFNFFDNKVKKFTNPNGVKKYGLKEYASSKFFKRKKEKKYFVFLYNKYYNIYNTFLNSYIMHGCFLISYLLLLVLLIKQKKMFTYDFLISLVLFSVVYLNLLIVSFFHSRLVSRYHYVLLLFQLIGPVVFTSLIFNNLKRSDIKQKI